MRIIFSPLAADGSVDVLARGWAGSSHIVVSNHAIKPVLQPRLPYDTLKDFAPVSVLARTPIVAYASPSFPVKNRQEIVAHAKAHPDCISFGSAGTGSVTHLTGEMLNAQAGAPHREAARPGRIEFSVNTESSVDS